MNAGTASESVLIYVLHIGNLYGTERMALATLSALKRYGLRVLFAPHTGGAESVVEAARSAGFQVEVFNTRKDLWTLMSAWFSTHRHIDVIGTAVSEAVFCAALARRYSVRVRQVQVAHGGTDDAHAFGKKRYMRHFGVRIVAVSPFVRDKLVAYGVRPQDISVVPNFLPREDLAPSRRPPYEVKPIGESGAVRIAIVSRVDRIKRIDVLLETLERGRLTDFQFDVYGTGTELEAFKARSRGLGNLVFHGFVPDVRTRIAESDAVLHLCPTEPFGLVILEAFAARIAVIVPSTGGAGELVEDGTTGFRFVANSEDDLERALQGVRHASSQDLDGIVIRAARELETHFSAEAGATNYQAALALAAQGAAT